MNIDKRQIERRFRASLRCSPAAAYTALRVDYAGHLVFHTQKPIAAIAVECGFCDSSHLSKVFRIKFGETPHAYRKRLDEIRAA